MNNLQSLKRAHANWKYTAFISLGIVIITLLGSILLDCKIIHPANIIISKFTVFFIFLISLIVLAIAIIKEFNYANELEDAEIMASMSEEWEEVSFNETNCIDTFLRTDNISKVLVKKYTDKRIKVKLVFKKTKKGKRSKKSRVYPITLDEARSFIDLDKFRV